MDFAELGETTQKRLIGFLQTDLDLGFTFVKMAQTREAGPARERLVQNARKVVEAVRRFEGRIADPKAWKAIKERADELQHVLLGSSYTGVENIRR